MNDENPLDNLQKRNDYLKSKLIHEQLKYNNYDFKNIKKQSLNFIKEYRQNKSFYKSSIKTGISQDVAFNWFIQGMSGNEIFRAFYLVIKNISVNNEVTFKKEDEAIEEFIVSQYGDGWSYKTYINDEKIFIIANELEDLKKKVRARNLPID